MIAEDCSNAQSSMARLGRSVCQAQAQVRRVQAMFNRVARHLDTLEGAGEDAEGGWRRGQH